MPVTNLIRFPSRQRAREEAALWVARFDRGLTEAERAEFGCWASRSTNRRILREFSEFWDQMACLSELAELFPLREPRVNLRRPEIRFAALATAASLVLCLLASGVWLWQQRGAGTAVEPALATVTEASASWTRSVETLVGDSQVIALPDGSTVTANTDTRIEIRLAADSRDVYLMRGEAFFSVAHDTARPFRVHAGDRLVQAVGTAFNVRLHDPATIEVTVTEGRVKVLGSAAGPVATGTRANSKPATAEETYVSANQALVVASDRTAVRQLDEVSRDQKLAWQHGMLVFQGEPLELALTEVSRYTRTRFVIADERLRQVRVGGYFRAGDVDGVLLALERNFAIDAVRDSADRIVLTPR